MSGYGIDLNIILFEKGGCIHNLISVKQVSRGFVVFFSLVVKKSSTVTENRFANYELVNGTLL